MTQYSPQQQFVPVAPPRGLSIASFVLGLVAFFFGFVFVVPTIGLVLGFSGLRREPAGRGFALAGIWINGIVLAGWVLLIVFVVLALVAGLITIPFLTQ